ncbi:MAG: RNA polymerase sigma factor [Alphaproteobacteria bacterium]|nr:MAG: RNA polymerase sigma factor [Alphaproteobacteria bacterium]
MQTPIGATGFRSGNKRTGRTVWKNDSAILRRRLVTALPRLKRFALALAGQETDADDLVQATVLKALEKAARFEERDDRAFHAWLFTLARRVWIDEWRRRRARGAGREDPVEAADTLARTDDALAETRMTVREVLDALAGLPEDQRAVLVLVAVEGLRYREAAEVLGVPVGTIMSRLARARAKLSAQLTASTEKQASLTHGAGE